MKRKTFFILAIVLGLALSITTIALAKNFTYYVDGEITAVHGDPPTSVDIMTDGGYTVTVSLPAGFTGTLVEGYTVFFKGLWVEGGFEAEDVTDFYMEAVILTVNGDGTITIDTGDGIPVIITIPDTFVGELNDGDIVRLVGDMVDEILVWISLEVVDPEGVDEGNPEGWKGGIYCDGGKEHPVANKIAEMYGDPEWVKEQFCTGFGFGEIMHAIILADGDLIMARWILAMRIDHGWGQIWKELGLAKNDKGSVPPPGQLKKPDDAANQPPGWANKPDKENKIRGWEKNQNKVKGPKNK
jgi:hypothetical protein